MIRGLSVYSDNGENAWLPLSDPRGTGIAVLNVTGLSPVKADLRINANAGSNRRNARYLGWL